MVKATSIFFGNITVPALVVTIITILLGREGSDGADPRDDNLRFVEDDPVEALQPERARP